jgi:hypothetical protein
VGAAAPFQLAVALGKALSLTSLQLGQGLYVAKGTVKPIVMVHVLRHQASGLADRQPHCRAEALCFERWVPALDLPFDGG